MKINDLNRIALGINTARGINIISLGFRLRKKPDKTPEEEAAARAFIRTFAWTVALVIIMCIVLAVMTGLTMSPAGTEYDGEYITYCRTNTRDVRNDHARMVVRVHPVIRGLVEKCRGKERVFNFSERFSSMGHLNHSINIGLKEIGRELGIENLQFYAARHSMATIAINDVRIDKWTVNEMLCHTDMAMKVTDLYIKKDFAPVNEANFRLLEYMFKDEGRD